MDESLRRSFSFELNIITGLINKRLKKEIAHIIVPIFSEGKKDLLRQKIKSVEDVVDLLRKGFPPESILYDLKTGDKELFKNYRGFPKRDKKRQQLFFEGLCALFAKSLILAEADSYRTASGKEPFPLDMYREEVPFHPDMMKISHGRLLLISMLPEIASLQLELTDPFVISFMGSDLPAERTFTKKFCSALTTFATMSNADLVQTKRGRGVKGLTDDDLRVLGKIIVEVENEILDKTAMSIIWYRFNQYLQKIGKTPLTSEKTWNKYYKKAYDLMRLDKRRKN